jgi:HEPN domain-containing protein
LGLKKSVQGWFRKADEDLFVARCLRDVKNEMGLNALAFHCQQAIEKLLKAYLTHNEKAFKKKHDILYLLEIARKIDPTLAKIFMPAKELSPYAIAVRYPDALVDRELTFNDAKRFIALAEKCHGEILSRIQDKLPLFNI